MFLYFAKNYFVTMAYWHNSILIWHAVQGKAVPCRGAFKGSPASSTDPLKTGTHGRSNLKKAMQKKDDQKWRHTARKVVA